MAPSVVSVEAVKPPSPGKTKSTEESGSGVIARIDGVPGIVVITNNHVINGAKADQITIHFADDKILRPAESGRIRNPTSPPSRLKATI